ncbi:MAG: multidrug effflux MFS transporter [Desulfobacterales bacterium]|nr:multidrug effflux MFS transporter [Desulfobacterales bacterium]
MKKIQFILLLALLAAFPPLATDMYLPAIPFLQSLWTVPLSIINLTLVLFFVVYCASLLIYGPLSDRFGRRPPLMAGILCFVAGSFLCALAKGVTMLIVARVIQAFGAASASAISMAMTKDRLEGKEREQAMGYVAVIMAIAPMVSPMIGSEILKIASWPFIFIAQGCIGMVALVGVFFFKESHPNPSAVSVMGLVRAYGRVMRNRRFMSMVGCSSLVGLPSFAFIGASSTIYMVTYHLSAQEFSLFFGGNALCFMAGAMVCSRLGAKVSSARLVQIGFGGICLGGALMMLNLFTGPWALALPMGGTSFFMGLSRPPANHLALEQVSRDVGVASSILIFSYFIIGALGMALVSFEGGSTLSFIGGISAVIGLVLFFWWGRLKGYAGLDKSVSYEVS